MSLIDPLRADIIAFARAEKAEKERESALCILDQLNKHPIIKARKKFELGIDGYDHYVTNLRKKAGTHVNDSVWVYRRFELMIDCIFNVLKDYGNFMLEHFQLELLRAAVIGVAAKQLGNQLFLYKHLILKKLYLATPDICNYDPYAPATIVAEKIDKIFKYYANRYTAATVPRRCGKSTIIEIIIAAALIYLEIDILLQTHRKNTCVTLYQKISKCIKEIQKATWFPQEFKLLCIQGEMENQQYFSSPAVKNKPSICHYMPTGSNVSIHQLI